MNSYGTYQGREGDDSYPAMGWAGLTLLAAFGVASWACVIGGLYLLHLAYVALT